MSGTDPGPGERRREAGTRKPFKAEGRILVIGGGPYPRKVATALEGLGFTAKVVDAMRLALRSLDGARAVVFEGGLEAAEKLYVATHDTGVPLVAIVATMEPAAMASLLRKGVYEIASSRLTKPGYAAALVVKALIERGRRDRERKSLAGERADARAAETSARIDVLTGLFNRRAVSGELDRIWERACEAGLDLSVAMFDVDHFKSINDRFGHAIGDKALKAVGAYLRETSRVGDVLGRWGGEEFIAVLPRTDAEAAVTYAGRVVSGLRSRPPANDLGQLRLTLSGGVFTVRCAMGMIVSDVIRKADSLLYRAKQEGRDRICAENRG